MSLDEPSTGEIPVDDPEYQAILRGDDTATEAGSTVLLVVHAPKEPEPKPFRFPYDESVADAATTAATAFKYAVGTPSFRTKDGTVLDRTMSLRAAGLRNGDKVDLVDAGGGV